MFRYNSRKNLALRIFLVFLIFNITLASAQVSKPISHLQKKGNATQLLVDGKPFLILGGELGNSSSSSTQYMNDIWPNLKKLNLNTVLLPVYWELIEPREGEFDFSLVNDMILGARQHQLRLVLLWFGSWKNSMSCYAPEWVKNNYARFPRARDISDKPVEILSPFAKENLDADKKAFAELMRFIRKIDEKDRTVIMIQVENEIGMLPDARDYHPQGIKEYSSEVPDELITFLIKNKNSLMPEFLSMWGKAGYKEKGNWQEIFGKEISTDEIFQAWYFAKYAEAITAAGKAAYPLPMFVNAALNRLGKLPGQYPSAGPLPHLMDVWKAAAPSVDILAPDIYFADFKKWCRLYDRGGNPLLLPEVRYESFSGPESYEPGCGPKAFYAFGNHNAIGFSPFFIESTSDQVKEPITPFYKTLAQLSPLILEHQGTNTMRGFLLDKEHQSDTIWSGGYQIIVKHDYTLGWSEGSKDEIWPITGGMIICTAEGEYFVAGEGIVLTFPPVNNSTIVGIESIDEGSFENGKWKPARRLNGDQSHQGRHLRISVGSPEIQFLKLYKYE